MEVISDKYKSISSKYNIKVNIIYFEFYPPKELERFRDVFIWHMK